ncbi:MAG: hypothetical protein ABIS50_04340 [Luteolibacter sp.]|uniref:hypothetical protein n=1 Tax=Luteolibacter sp. TaxID=1962973 RepID=UPI0032648C47
MKRSLILVALPVFFLSAILSEAAVIISIQRLDVDSINPAVSESVSAGDLRSGGHLYVDSGLAYGTLPSYLINADFIQMDNSDNAKSDYQLRLTLSMDSKIYLLIDDRVSSLPTTMPWVANQGFADSGVNILTVGSNLPYSVYSMIAPAGNLTLGANGSGSANMFTVVATPVPEPSAMLISCVASAVLLLRTGRRRRERDCSVTN